MIVNTKGNQETEFGCFWFLGREERNDSSDSCKKRFSPHLFAWDSSVSR
jgi:hypothetical protein